MVDFVLVVAIIDYFYCDGFLFLLVYFSEKDIQFYNDNEKQSLLVCL